MVEDVTSEAPQLSRENLIKIGAFILLFTIFVVGVSALMTHYFSPGNQEFVKRFVHSRNEAMWIYFIYVTIACVIVPLPTLPADVIFLKLANPVAVIGLRLLADIAGSSIDFFLARKYGRPLLRRWFSDKNYKFIERASEHVTWQQYFIVAMIPLFNTELLAYAGGISKLKFRQVIGSLILAVGYRLVFVYLVLKI